MKTLHCKDIGGTCDAAFTGDSILEIGKLAKAHVQERIAAGDETHKEAAECMRAATPEKQAAMMADWQRKFEDAPEVSA